MRLGKTESIAINNPLQRFVQKKIEFATFRRFGLIGEDKDILEIGCGSGYGARLLSGLSPQNYVGIDLMPEQIDLAEIRDLPGFEFRVMDATRLEPFADRSKDVIVIFGILHHIEGWKEVLQECYRVLRPSGLLFSDEPDRSLLDWFDRVPGVSHPRRTAFSLAELEEAYRRSGFTILDKRYLMSFGLYGLQKAPNRTGLGGANGPRR